MPGPDMQWFAITAGVEMTAPYIWCGDPEPRPRRRLSVVAIKAKKKSRRAAQRSRRKNR